jgi:acetyl-CoA C-acetyltransferase
MHAIATMAGALRSEPGAWGFVSALGWYATKHSVGVYSSEPPARAFSVEDVQDEVDRLPSRGARFDYAGRVTIEASTVVHERDGQPSLGIVACLTPDGERAWANTRDPALMRALMGDDVAGESAVLEGEGLLKL